MSGEYFWGLQSLLSENEWKRVFVIDAYWSQSTKKKHFTGLTKAKIQPCHVSVVLTPFRAVFWHWRQLD